MVFGLECLILLGLALMQEVALGWGFLFIWVLAVAMTHEPRGALSWAFAAGLMTDLISSGHWGVAALTYLVVSTLVVLLATNVPRQSRILVTLGVLMLVGGWQLGFKQRIVAAELLGLAICFWVLLPLAEWLGTNPQQRTELRLKHEL